MARKATVPPYRRIDYRIGILGRRGQPSERDPMRSSATSPISASISAPRSQHILSFQDDRSGSVNVSAMAITAGSLVEGGGFEPSVSP